MNTADKTETLHALYHRTTPTQRAAVLANVARCEVGLTAQEQAAVLQFEKALRVGFQKHAARRGMSQQQTPPLGAQGLREIALALALMLLACEAEVLP